jgi:hypothetical protein
MHDTHTKTTPIGLTRYAHDFFDSSRALEDVLNKETLFNLVSPMPSLYLIGHSIELVLKAYLLQHGVTIHALRSKKYGHNLNACLSRANDLGLDSLVNYFPAEEGSLDLLNALYSSKQLEYIVTGTKYIPLFQHVESFAKRLIHAVAIDVGYPQFKCS